MREARYAMKCIHIHYVDLTSDCNNGQCCPLADIHDVRPTIVVAECLEYQLCVVFRWRGWRPPSRANDGAAPTRIHAASENVQQWPGRTVYVWRHIRQWHRAKWIRIYLCERAQCLPCWLQWATPTWSAALFSTRHSLSCRWSDGKRVVWYHVT